MSTIRLSGCSVPVDRLKIRDYLTDDSCVTSMSDAMQSAGSFGATITFRNVEVMRKQRSAFEQCHEFRLDLEFLGITVLYSPGKPLVEYPRFPGPNRSKDIN